MNRERKNLSARIYERSTGKAELARARRLRLSPPGFDSEQEHAMNILAMVTALLVSSLWLLSVLVSQSEAVQEVLKRPDLAATMKHLTFTPARMLGWSLCIWTLPIGVALWNGSVRYRYHFLESRSIYTMKRLSDPRELYRRCFILPGEMILMSLMMVLVLTAVFCFFFHLAIPARYVPEGAYLSVLRQLWHWWHFT